MPTLTETPSPLLQFVEPHADLMGPSVIPSQFADATLGALPSAAIRKLLRSYGQQFWDVAGQGIAPVLLGPPATYKSYAAAVLVKQVEAAQLKAAWCTVPVQLTELERKRYEPKTDACITAWKRVPFLVLDDFGMIRVGSWQHDILCEIAMARFEARRPTVWTGNVLVQEGEARPNPRALIEQHLGIQLARRLFERSEGFRLYVGGK